MDRSRLSWLACCGWLLLLLGGCASAEQLCSLVVLEQRHLDLRDPLQIPSAPLPALPTPETVTQPAPPGAAKELSLDEAIRIALANSQVVRVLAGTTAVSTGQTIYDPAISNTDIDQAKAPFDPTLSMHTNWNRTEPPQAFLDPTRPLGAGIFGLRDDSVDGGISVAKKNVTGGTAKLDISDIESRFQPFPLALNPQNQSAVTLSYTQPLLKGAGIAPNIAPILIARINTERSFFQLKDSMQDMIRGVVEAYWAVVFARVDMWARQQQVDQSKEAYDRAVTRHKEGLANAGDVAQTKSALATFQAGLVGAQANVLQREGALRNIMGLTPTDPPRLILVTPPTTLRVEPRWQEILGLAQEYRADLIELNLIIEADQQSIVIANNQARPQVDTSMFYRWNGLEGTTPSGIHLGTGAGQYTDWTLGVNFSVPLGLRQSRAALRKAELILARDRANLDQGMHAAEHALAGSLRSLAQFYEQYKAYKESRAAARENLEQQMASYRNGLTIYLNVLQAMSDWGNSVSAEAQALAQYNTELANLERLTGTILETHGVRFSEERYRSIGPFGRLTHKRWYPSAMMPTPNAGRYPVSPEPAEKSFNLENPVTPQRTVPPPRIGPPTPELPAPRPMLLAPKL